MNNEPQHTESALEPTTGRGLSRRQLIKAGAWAAPVVVLATATPAAASSKGLITFVSGSMTNGLLGSVSKRLTANFTSTYSEPKTLTRISITGGSWIDGYTPDVIVPGNATNVQIALGSVWVNPLAQSTVTIVFSVSTGTTPATENVTVVIPFS